MDLHNSNPVIQGSAVYKYTWSSQKSSLHRVLSEWPSLVSTSLPPLCLSVLEMQRAVLRTKHGTSFSRTRVYKQALNVSHPIREIGFTVVVIVLSSDRWPGDSDHAGLINLTKVRSLCPESLKSEVAEMKRKVLWSWWQVVLACFLDANVSLWNITAFYHSVYLHFHCW